MKFIPMFSTTRESFLPSFRHVKYNSQESAQCTCTGLYDGQPLEVAFGKFVSFVNGEASLLALLVPLSLFVTCHAGQVSVNRSGYF